MNRPVPGVLTICITQPVSHLWTQIPQKKIVTEICVAGVHKYDHLDDEAQIRFRLASDLYHRVKRRLWFTTPNTDALPEKLQVLTKQERLMIAIRLVSGLSSQEAGQICGFAEPAYKQILSTVMRKCRL